MGIEMRLHLVDSDCLMSLLDIDWKTLVDGMENCRFRSLRPSEDKAMNRAFDIDSEADFLDLADHISGSGSAMKVLRESNGHEALLKLIEFSSPGYWEAWEGRSFLYIENAIGHPVDDVDSMYLESIWDEVREGLSRMNADEYAEKVCEDWMERRKNLGETLDEKQDPRIIPTFEAHDRTARALHHAVNKKGFVQILGREHLEARNWGHGDWNLGNLLDA